MKRIFFLLLLFFCINTEAQFIINPYVYGTTPACSATDADAIAFLSAAGITDATICTAIDNLVIAAKANGWWTTKKAIYPMVGGTSTTCSYNLKDPGTYQLTFQGSPTFAGNGVDWDGSTQYAQTGLIPSSVLSTSSYTISYYSGENTAAGDKCEIGSYSFSPNTDNEVNVRYLSNLFYATINDQTGYANITNTDATGYFIATRTATNTVRGYKNGTELINQAQPAALSTRELYLGAANGDGTAVSFSDRRCQFATIGDGINSIVAGSESTDVAAFQTALGR